MTTTIHDKREEKKIKPPPNPEQISDEINNEYEDQRWRWRSAWRWRSVTNHNTTNLVKLAPPHQMVMTRIQNFSNSSVLVSGSEIAELDRYRTDKDLSHLRRDGVLAIWVGGSWLTCSGSKCLGIGYLESTSGSRLLGWSNLLWTWF